MIGKLRNSQNEKLGRDCERSENMKTIKKEENWRRQSQRSFDVLSFDFDLELGRQERKPCYRRENRYC